MISTSGDTHLGGEDFDHRVMDYFIKLIKKKYKVDISKDNRALQKLRREAERAKRALSSQHQVPTSFFHPFFAGIGTCLAHKCFMFLCLVVTCCNRSSLGS